MKYCTDISNRDLCLLNPRVAKFSEAVKRGRCQLNLTQSQLAELVGVTQQTVQKWEHGKAVVSFDNFDLLADVIGPEALYESFVGHKLDEGDLHD